MTEAKQLKAWERILLSVLILFGVWAFGVAIGFEVGHGIGLAQCEREAK